MVHTPAAADLRDAIVRLELRALEQQPGDVERGGSNCQRGAERGKLLGNRQASAEVVGQREGG